MLQIILFAWGLWLRIPGRFCLLLLDWMLVRVNNLVNYLLNLVLLAQPGEFSFCQQRTSTDQLGMEEQGSHVAYVWKCIVGTAQSRSILAWGNGKWGGMSQALSRVTKVCSLPLLINFILKPYTSNFKFVWGQLGWMAKD